MLASLFSSRLPLRGRGPKSRRTSRKETLAAWSRMSPGEQLEQRHAMAAILSMVGPTDAVPEGQQAAFTLKLSEASKVPQRVAITTTSGTATYGVDYFAPTKQVLVFAPGQTSQTFSISVLRDAGGDKVEGKETFTVVATPDDAQLRTRSQIVTIQDTSDSGGGGSTPKSNFQITFTYDSTVSLPVRQKLQQAADRWSKVIVGDLPDVTYQGRTIDDIEIAVTVVPASNLPSGAIAGAGYDARRSGTGGLPYHGFMEVSSAYVSAPGIMNVFTHEIGHALGFGSLWRQETDFKSLVSGIGTANPIFNGTNAVREYNSLFNVKGTSVPLYEQSSLKPANYDGSYGSHWRDSVFNNSSGTYFELMTHAYNVDGTVNGAAVPAILSRVTVGAMQDLGYVVNYSGADTYKLPSNSMNNQQATGGGSSNSRNLLWSTAAGTISTGVSGQAGAGSQGVAQGVAQGRLGGGVQHGSPGNQAGSRSGAADPKPACPTRTGNSGTPTPTVAPAAREQRPVVVVPRRPAQTAPVAPVSQPRPVIVSPRLQGVS